MTHVLRHGRERRERLVLRREAAERDGGHGVRHRLEEVHRIVEPRPADRREHERRQRREPDVERPQAPRGLPDRRGRAAPSPSARRAPTGGAGARRPGAAGARRRPAR